MKHTFLHISDLHYRSNWPEETELVCNRFFDDLATSAQNFQNAYLVFSGDLVMAGASESLYTDLLSRFSARLDKTGFPKERRICIPGNHDISRDALLPLLLMQDGSLSAMTDERKFNDNLPNLSKTFFTEKFRNYTLNEAKFARQTCCATDLGGTGWDLGHGIGVYCLNTALCSFGGLEDSTGKKISDKGRLHVDTRSLYRWLAETSSALTFRILVMHHPFEWLSSWAKTELENIVANNFHVVLSGHTHAASSIFSSRGIGGTVQCVAPPLFTQKGDLLGYSFVSIDSDSKTIDIRYRQWTPTHRFVTGTSFADNDTGSKSFPISSSPCLDSAIIEVGSPPRETLAILQAEFDEAITCYSSKKQIWVDRDLASLPETNTDTEDAILITPSKLSLNLRSCIIRAPKQFGLTCVGRAIALEHHKQSKGGASVALVDIATMPTNRSGVIKLVRNRCQEIAIEPSSLAGVILDNWQNDKNSRRILQEIKSEFPGICTILLHSLDDSTEIANSIEWSEVATLETYYLWALSRTRIRELVASYIQDMAELDDDIVTKKLIEDVDALNIHRTPLNCLLLLKLMEQAFDDSPVNRTEIIGRVLFLLFCQFNKIPRYASRPDLKDCEYALGYVCEWLIKIGRPSFTKNEFYAKVQEYCQTQILDLDCEILFSFLISENIFVRKGLLFEFRFTYWLYFFAAHRMHHDKEFASYILSNQRYAAIPEIIEFYTGIDRRRSDAVIRLTEDLKKMNSEFSVRTGISEDFKPFEHALWVPSQESLDKMHRQVEESVAESALPKVAKDAIADKSYNRAKPYTQELAKFVNESTLGQMVQTMKGAARALRNSDHVSPAAKKELFEEVMRCWTRVCQVLVLLVPLLSQHKVAGFEGMGFHLDKSFDEIKDERERWKRIMAVIAENVVRWYQDDLFSKKMGALFSTYVSSNQGELGELLVLLIMARQRPPGWEKEIENFIVRTKKNSFHLNRVYIALRSEFKTSFSTERTRQQIRRLAAMSVAKHETGSKHPNIKLVEKAAKSLDASLPKKDQTEGT